MKDFFLDYSDIIMRVIFLFITLYTLINGDCDFQTRDSQLLRDKLKEREIYNRM
jgi:hypothetical protein